MPEPARRFPTSVFGVGEEPDARFSLANERTFLAWISVGLAVLSVGVGVDAMASGLHPVFGKAASVVLIVAGIACPVQAWVGWMRTERSLRESTPLGPPWIAIPLVIVVVATGVLVLLGVLLA